MTNERNLYDTCGSSSSNESSSKSSSRESSSSSSSTTTATTTVYTESGVFCKPRLSESEKADIMHAYQANIGDELRAPIASLIARLVERGMEPEVIVHAIDITGMARRPSPWYLRAVLDRYDRQGLRTMVQVIRDEDEYAAAKESDQALPW